MYFFRVCPGCGQLVKKKYTREFVPKVDQIHAYEEVVLWNPWLIVEAHYPRGWRDEKVRP